MELIARIQFFHSIRNRIACKSVVKFVIIVASETSTPIPDLIKKCTFECTIFSKGDDSLCKYANNCDFTIVKEGDLGVCSVQVPISPNQYFIKIRAIDYPQNVTIMTLEAGPITVTTESVTASSLLLQSTRTFQLNNDIEIKILEEYGSTIGSHIWDSSIVLFEYFKEVHSFTSSHSLAIELGSGCALNGIQLALCKYFTNVFLTDKNYQLPLIQKNIELNWLQQYSSTTRMTSSTQVEVMELDWSSEHHSNRIYDRLLSLFPVHIIIAADVLYDVEAAIHLMNVIKRLSTPNVTKTFIAQKKRNVNTMNLNESHLDPTNEVLPLAVNLGFSSSIVYQRANVIVWLLQLL